jgi:hypothetical protein
VLVPPSPSGDRSFLNTRGFEEKGKEDWVWELERGLYGMLDYDIRRASEAAGLISNWLWIYKA